MPAVVQSTGNAGFVSSAGPFSQAFGSPNAAGNTLVAMGWMNGVQGYTPSVTDTQGNTWTLIEAENSNGSSTQMCAFVAFNCKAGANTVSLSSSGTPSAGMLFCIAEISGANTLDQKAGSSLAGGTTSITTPSITTTQANEIILSCVQTGLTTSSTVTQTQLGAVPGSSSYANAQYEFESATGTFSGTFTTVGSGCSGIIFSLYNVASGNAYDSTKPFIGSVRVLGSAPAGEANEFIGTMRVLASAPAGEANPYLGSVTLGTPSSGDSNPALGQVVVVASVPAGETDEYLGQVEES